MKTACTYTESIRERRCYQCGAQPAEPHQNDVLPYCDKCRREHENTQRKDKHE